MATEEHPRVKLRASMVTDVGVVRDHNEDSAYVDPGGHFFIVADGMGGHAAGEVASAMAVETVRELLDGAVDSIDAFAASPSEDARKGLIAVLEQAVRSAHGAVYERGARESDKQGMGTTLDVLLVAGPEAFVAHVGDSRTYLLRDGKAAQITTDHTVAEVLVIEGKLSAEEAQVSPLRTILVNAVGVAPDVGVEMAHVALRAGDQLLLCSDGLHDYFPIDQELADHVVGLVPHRALTEMVELAKQRGGHDNITGVLVDVLEADEAGIDTAADDAVTSSVSELSDLDDTASMELMSNGVPQEIGRDDTLPSERGTDDQGDGPPESKTAEGKKKRRAAGARRRVPVDRTEPYPAPGDNADQAAPPDAASETGGGGAAEAAANEAVADDEEDGPIEDDTLIGYPGAPPAPAAAQDAADPGDDAAPRGKNSRDVELETAPTMELPTVETLYADGKRDAQAEGDAEAATSAAENSADGDGADGDAADGAAADGAAADGAAANSAATDGAAADSAAADGAAADSADPGSDGASGADAGSDESSGADDAERAKAGSSEDQPGGDAGDAGPIAGRGA